MRDEHTLSASKDITRLASLAEPQLLSQDGGIMLRDFNPKAILRFQGRKCITCGNEIMEHWLRHADDPDLRAEYWCSKTGNQFSEGITDCTYDVPEEVQRFATEHDSIINTGDTPKA